MNHYNELRKKYDHCLDRFMDVFQQMLAEIEAKDSEIDELKSPSEPTLLSASPFEFKVVDDHIVRFKRDSGEEFGKVHKNDTDKLCLLISDLDSDLWKARYARSSVEKIHTEMVEKISGAISG
ncbi:MAG: hypothetical protein ABW134_11635 [Candidatus Thiodiazotropha endolucinida]